MTAEVFKGKNVIYKYPSKEIPMTAGISEETKSWGSKFVMSSR
jgi:hypothetical protein